MSSPKQVGEGGSLQTRNLTTVQVLQHPSDKTLDLVVIHCSVGFREHHPEAIVIGFLDGLDIFLGSLLPEVVVEPATVEDCISILGRELTFELLDAFCVFPLDDLELLDRPLGVKTVEFGLNGCIQLRVVFERPQRSTLLVEPLDEIGTSPCWPSPKSA
jgi:hypothetical protein